MPDFSNYQALREDGTATREFKFRDIEGVPSIISRPATSANSKYNSARLKTLNQRVKGGRAKTKITPASVDEARREDAQMLSKYCATGWGTAPVDAANQPVPFSAENCEAFLLAIPDWMFDEYRAWVSEPMNFVEADDDADAQAEAATPGE